MNIDFQSILVHLIVIGSAIALVYRFVNKDSQDPACPGCAGKCGEDKQ